MDYRYSIRQGLRRGPMATLLALIIGPLSALPSSAELYQVIDLGIDVSPTDINNLGTIVGSRKTDAGSVGFRQLSGGLPEYIPEATVANAVNERDQVTGNTLIGAFLFDDTQPLREWEGYGSYGINELSQLSGNMELDNPYRATPLPLDPARYTPDTDSWDNLGVARVYPRGTRDGVYADLYVLDDINDEGFAVGSRRRYGLTSSLSILTEPAFDTVIYLPIPYGGRATAINSQNMIVGATGSNTTPRVYSQAYLYDYDADELFPLGTLNGGLTSSAADINELNQVVGTSWLVTQPTSLYDPTQFHAFLWEDGTMTMTDLNDLIPENSGWTLTAATAINDNGDIVGTGLLNGEVHGFLLTKGQTPPPPPAPEPPVAVASADVTAGKVPLTVSFSAAGSYDPDGSIVDYAWDFGDGSAVVNEADPSHVYTERGTYIAVLTVTDSQGLTATAQVEIKARKSNGKGRR